MMGRGLDDVYDREGRFSSDNSSLSSSSSMSSTSNTSSVSYDPNSDQEYVAD